MQRILTMAMALWAAGTATVSASELSVKGREVLKKNEHAVVTVQVVVKVSSVRGSGELKRDITGTVIDPSGLTVVALSECDPYEVSRRLSPDSRVESEVSDVKILLHDGTELSSEVVLRDRDLDLAFLRPKAKPASPMTAVDLSNSGKADVLDEVIALNRLNQAASRAYSAAIEHISAVVQKPRTFYIPDSTMTATSSGCPAFLPDGKILGLFVMRAVNTSSGNYRENLTAIILPAEDILKGAKQAPEAKPEGEKKEEPKEPTEKK